MESPKARTFRKALELWPESFAFALALCRDRDEAEDLCQEAFMRLWAMERPVDDERPLGPLIFTIIKNQFRTRARRQRPEAFSEIEDVDGAITEDAADGPLARADRAERHELVQAALGQMNPLWRAALYLADGLGLSYAEIAEILDRTEDVVRVTLHRARLRVRVMLKSRIEETTES